MRSGQAEGRKPGTLAIRRRLLLASVVVAWVSFLVVSGLTAYVNYRLPHGPSYPTGEYTDPDYGHAHEIYVEDLSGLRIPGWAKFLRRSEGSLLWTGLALGSAVLTSLFAAGRGTKKDSEA